MEPQADDRHNHLIAQIFDLSGHLINVAKNNFNPPASPL
jgi:hypothetical protein